MYYLVVFEAERVVVVVAVLDGVPEMPLLLVLVVELVEGVPAERAAVRGGRGRGGGGRVRRLRARLRLRLRRARARARARQPARLEPTLLWSHEIVSHINNVFNYIRYLTNYMFFVLCIISILITFKMVD